MSKKFAMQPMFAHMRMMDTAKNSQLLMVNYFAAKSAATTLFFADVIDSAEYRGINKKIDILNKRNNDRIYFAQECAA